jgi:hypothetical protein
MPRFFASSSASVMLPGDEYRDGMATPTTLAAPRASTAIVATMAESMPPERPTATFSKPFLWM